jgi:hypothetical protein
MAPVQSPSGQAMRLLLVVVGFSTVTGRPQCGQDWAIVETSFPQSRQVVSAINYYPYVYLVTCSTILAK